MTMDRKKEMEEAKRHSGPGQCYIKAVDRELIVSGDMIAVIRAAERIITRLGDISGRGFVETWLAVKQLHNWAEQNLEKAEIIENGKMIERPEMALLRENRELKEQAERKDRELEDALSLVARVKEKSEKELRERDSRIKELTKELEGTEHRLMEMEAQNQFI